MYKIVYLIIRCNMDKDNIDLDKILQDIEDQIISTKNLLSKIKT